MIGFELGLKINFHGGGRSVGWPEQMRIRLTLASTGIGGEIGGELDNILDGYFGVSK